MAMLPAMDVDQVERDLHFDRLKDRSRADLIEMVLALRKESAELKARLHETESWENE